MKGRFPLARVEAVAAGLLAELAGVCERVEVVGSTRRGKETVGDLEVMFCPRLAEGVNHATAALERLEREGVLERRTAHGVECYGRRNKFVVHVASGLPVDLFQVPRAGWFSSMVSRTGSRRFCIRVAEAAEREGLKWDHARGFWRHGQLLVPQSERHLFELVRMAWVAPRFR